MNLKKNLSNKKQLNCLFNYNKKKLNNIYYIKI